MQTIKDNLRIENVDTLVSIFIPCYNESAIIERLLDSLYHQSYPRTSLEIIIVDGMSTDDTREKVKSFARAHPDLNITIIDNEKRVVTYAINLGLRAAQGDYLIRMDAHSIPAKDYISLCVQNLREGRGDNVGGLLDIQPGNDSYPARCIAVAAALPLGSGGAQYRSGSEAASVDTVAFGAFTKETVERNGYFNEKLGANEDYEWNTRLRANGGRIWFDPAIRCQYFARANYSALAKQYFNYGYWKAVMLRSYPNSFRLRQMAPPAVVVTLLVSIVVSLMSFGMGWSYLSLVAIIVAFAYLTALMVGCVFLSAKFPRSLTPGVVIALLVMHLSWGSGFWYSLLNKRSH